MSERLQNPDQKNLKFSWSDLRKNPFATAQPISEKQKGSEKKKGVAKMSVRRRLSASMMTIHNKPNSRTFTLNQVMSKEAFNKCLNFLTVGNENGKIYVMLTKSEMPGHDFARLCFNKQGKNATATASGYGLVTAICEHFGLKDGDYYFRVKKSDIRKESPDYMVIEVESIIQSQPINQEDEKEPFEKSRVCPNCGRELPENKFYRKGKGLQSWCIDCCRKHGKLRNGTTGEYRDNPTISDATDQQLYDELKRRGYQGELTKHQVLK
jgi:hypothetical protein